MCGERVVKVLGPGVIWSFSEALWLNARIAVAISDLDTRREDPLAES
jgi:hypothetical protein